jgi:uncharacterized circularly permuted ATP-grasp superfamily protein
MNRGYGMLVGPHATAKNAPTCPAHSDNPRNYIAQPT